MTGRMMERFSVAELTPRSTGLPVTVWLGPSESIPYLTLAGTDPYKVAEVRLIPEIVFRPFTQYESRLEALVTHWVKLNHAVLLDFCYGKTDTAEFCSRLLRIGDAK